MAAEIWGIPPNTLYPILAIGLFGIMVVLVPRQHIRRATHMIYHVAHSLAYKAATRPLLPAKATAACLSPAR